MTFIARDIIHLEFTLPDATFYNYFSLQITTPASAMLSNKTRKRIRAWAVFVKLLLDDRIPKDERDLKERLEELISNSLKKSDLKFECIHISTLCAGRAPFPLDDETFCQKLKQVSSSSEAVRLQTVLLPVWKAVMDKSPNAWVI